MTVYEAGMLPGRKSPALWKLEDGHTIVPIAYFTSREAFDEWMDHGPSYRKSPGSTDTNNPNTGGQ